MKLVTRLHIFQVHRSRSQIEVLWEPMWPLYSPVLCPRCVLLYYDWSQVCYAWMRFVPGVFCFIVPMWTELSWLAFLHLFSTPHFGLTISSPAYSTSAFCCRIFRSRIFLSHIFNVPTPTRGFPGVRIYQCQPSLCQTDPCYCGNKNMFPFCHKILTSSYKCQRKSGPAL